MKNGFFLRVYMGILSTTLIIVLVCSGFMVTAMSVQRQTSLENEVQQQAEDVTTYLVEMNQITTLRENRTLQNMLLRKMESIEEKYSAKVWLVTFENGLVQYLDNSWNISPRLSDPVVLKKLLSILETDRPIRVQGLFTELGDQIVTIGVPWKYNDEDVVGAVLLHISADQLSVDPRVVLPTTLAAALVACVLAMIVAYFIARAQARPVQAIRQAVTRFAKGDFSERVQLRGGSDELRALAGDINGMADELSNLEESRKAFVSNVSHELRSPLTCMQGYMQGMLDGTIPSDEQPRYMQVVLDETRRLTKLVGDLLKLSRYESGKIPLNIARFDVNEMIRRCIIGFGTRLEEKDVDVNVDFAGSECYVMGDSDRINQVVLNLMDNAIKFLPPEGGRLTIATRPEGKQALITIADNGSGISAEDLPHIFDRFYKADKAHTSGMGTGLGLSIVRRIVNDHGQQISVQSEEGQGASFTFTLELARDQASAHRRAAELPAGEEEPSEK
ncbi:MAG: HAMP domain-containing sensor histidine kinase [Clostridia bacterium]|nr:HAMP domain-containing sensor histidine kinase [Clostridia bacterium]